MLRSIVELVAFGAFRLWAMALIMAGLALVAAALSVQPMGSEMAWVRVLSADRSAWPSRWWAPAESRCMSRE